MFLFELQVKDVMRNQDDLPICRESDFIMDQLVELTSKGCKCLLVIDDRYRLIGTFTDGDLRCTLRASGEAILKKKYLSPMASVLTDPKQKAVYMVPVSKQPRHITRSMASGDN